MATDNPTGGGSAVSFTFPRRLGDFLRHRLPLNNAFPQAQVEHRALYSLLAQLEEGSRR